jgi:hypothetical protein
MPCEYLIDPDRRLVTSRGTGTFRYCDYLEHIEKMGPDPRFRPEFNHLVDCRRFEHLDLTSKEIQAIGRLTVFAASSRRAFVVASLLHFGLARMFARLSRPQPPPGDDRVPQPGGCGYLARIADRLRSGAPRGGDPNDAARLRRLPFREFRTWARSTPGSVAAAASTKRQRFFAQTGPA